MESDRTRWDERYAAHGLAVASAPEAIAGRAGLLDLVPPSGRALDVACGTGAQAVWLASAGLDVLALDVSRRAIELTVDAAAAAGCAERVDARVHDLDTGLPDGIGRFDVVVCQRFRDTALYDPILNAVRPGGIGIVTVLSAVGLDGDPGPFHAPAGELGDRFATALTEVLDERESAGVASIVFRLR